MIHFVGKDSLFDDYIFSLGYYLALQHDGDENNMFPSFKGTVLDKDDKSDSHIPNASKRAWALLYTISQTYVVDDDERTEIRE